MATNGLVIDYDGTKRWYLNDKPHREDGPAVEYLDGSKIWIINGEWHREDGPAYDGWNGKSWWINGLLHREDGPAAINVNGSKWWFYRGKEINVSSNEEFLRLIKLKAFW